MNEEQVPSEPLVLVVDDSPFIRSVLRRQLERGGYRVAEAADGLSAIAKARELNANAMILDEEMPNLNGRGVLRLLSEEPDLNQIPVLFLTSNESIAAEVRALGAAGCVVKGRLSTNEFLAVLSTALEFHIRGPESGQIGPGWATSGTFAIDATGNLRQLPLS